MPYSFTEIEKEKSRVIKFVFAFLLVFYFFAAQLLWVVTKLFFNDFYLPAKIPQLFSFGELIIVSIVALAVASLHWYYSTRNMIADLTGMLDARPPDLKDTYHKKLQNVVDEVSVATGGKNISCYVVPSSGMNAFAISDFEGNSVIGVTEGLLSRISRSQLEAVIGHEAAHIASGDSFSTTVICSLFGIYGALLEGINKITLRRSGDGSEERISVGARFGAYLLVVYMVLLVIKGANYLLNLFISRQREYRADAVAVRLTRDPLALSEALYLISRGWRGVGVIPGSLSPIFIMTPDTDDLEESEGVFSDLFSTHPPVKNRLKILLSMAHSDLGSLKSGIKERARTPVEEVPVAAGISSAAPVKDWLFYKDSSWQGPFAIEDLISSGLNPASWVSNINEGIIRQAAESSSLTDALKGRIPGPTKPENVCPKCDQPLSEVLYEGAPVMKCHYCGGIASGRDVAARVLAREDYSFHVETAVVAEALMKSHWAANPPNFFAVTDRLTCPVCKNKMDRGFFTYGLPIVIDRCVKCGNIWFDKGELEILQYLTEKNRGTSYYKRDVSKPLEK